jgi:hypothetical protein
MFNGWDSNLQTDYLGFYVAGNGTNNALEKFRVLQNGNFGIGTTSPKEKLDINGNIRGNRPGGALRVQTDHGYIDLGPQNNGWAHIYTDMSKFIFNKSVYAVGGFSSYSSNDLELQTNAATKLTIKNNTGNIGIGTTAPSARLQVKGQANDYSNKHFIVTDQYNNEDFVIRGNGQVEIGYDIDIPNSSLYKLAVGGGILAEEVKVQLKESWPDYVFENAYQLTDLSELEKFIQTNKHLPEIPSAAEVKADGGIELGEMNRLLLQKIEELTLHAIRQEKLINALSEKVEKLENK